MSGQFLPAVKLNLQPLQAGSHTWIGHVVHVLIGLFVVFFFGSQIFYARKKITFNRVYYSLVSLNYWVPLALQGLKFRVNMPTFYIICIWSFYIIYVKKSASGMQAVCRSVKLL